jgi:hypothetical protein
MCKVDHLQNNMHFIRTSVLFFFIVFFFFYQKFRPSIVLIHGVIVKKQHVFLYHLNDKNKIIHYHVNTLLLNELFYRIITNF